MKQEKRTPSLLHRVLTSPATTMIAFGLAVVLLMGSGIGAARAALTYRSETYASHVEMYDIGVTLMENGEKVSWRDYKREEKDGSWDEATGVLLANMLTDAGDTTLKIGKQYKEKLAVKNSGTINQYVRMSIYKYWTDPQGNKIASTYDSNGNLITNTNGQYGTTALAPALIDLHYVNQDLWIEDKEAATVDEGERRVFYYSKLLYAEDSENPNDASKPSVTEPLTDLLKVDQVVGRKVNQKIEETNKNGNTYKKITTTYTYDGYRFTIEATVDAVQEHNAVDAIKSAWGREVEINNNTLVLVDKKNEE